jgi:hypothetical protein
MRRRAGTGARLQRAASSPTKAVASGGMPTIENWYLHCCRNVFLIVFVTSIRNLFIVMLARQICVTCLDCWKNAFAQNP